MSGPHFVIFANEKGGTGKSTTAVHTAIALYLRAQQPMPALPLDNAPNAAHLPDLGTRIAAAELWRQIEQRLADPRDRLLARCVFVEDLKPRQIIKSYPAHWKDEREVSVELYRIRRLLRNDPELRRLAG